MVGPVKIIFALFLAMTCELSIGREARAIDYDYMGVTACVTPFDSRYRRVQRYLESKEPSHHQNLAESQRSDFLSHLRVLKKYLRIASRFEYIPDGKGMGTTAYGYQSFSHKRNRSSSDCWQLPEETEGRGGGDCEDKAIWLYARLIQMGFENVRLVVGKYHVDQPAYHAWVVYYLTEKIYILDPTINDGLREARHYPQGFFKPSYSYSKGSRWCHMGGYRQLLTSALKNRSNQ